MKYRARFRKNSFKNAYFTYYNGIYHQICVKFVKSFLNNQNIEAVLFEISDKRPHEKGWHRAGMSFPYTLSVRKDGKINILFILTDRQEEWLRRRNLYDEFWIKITNLD